MDAAKAAAWLAANRIEAVEQLFAGTLRRPPLPLVLIGTTAGTGSEVSAVSVLTLDRDLSDGTKAGRKKSITHPNCYARYAFADPRYTATLPRRATVSAALDALSHAAEGFLSPSCGDVTASFAEKALPLISGGSAGWQPARACRTPPCGNACCTALCGRAWCSTRRAPPIPIPSATF